MSDEKEFLPEYWEEPVKKKPIVENGSVTCPKCGLVFKGAFGYVCPRNDCPTFARITS